MLSPRDPLKMKDAHRLKLKRWKQIFYVNRKIKNWVRNTYNQQSRL